MTLTKTLLAFSICLPILLTGCNDSDNNDTSSTPTPGSTPTPNPTPTPEKATVKTKAAIYSTDANMALFGKIKPAMVQEVKLEQNDTALLLDDTTQGYAAFGLEFKTSQKLNELSAQYLSDISSLLKKEGAVVNILVNKNTKNAQAEVNTITLDIDLKNTAQDAAYIRNLVLNYINKNKIMTNLPISVNSTDTKLRLSLALWVTNGDAYVWGGAYSAKNYNSITQSYNDLITATGITSAQPLPIISATETFTQANTGSNAVDILWSIDSSGSMSEEQKNLADGANQFFSALNKAGVDYRLAVNVQDDGVCKKLRTLSDKKTQFIDRSTPNAESAWKTLASPGTYGSSNETGFYCVREADLSQFDRPNAKNLVVFVSDEPENETYDDDIYLNGYTARSFNDYKDYFIKTGATYFAIAGTATMLRPDFTATQPGYKDPDYLCDGEGGSAAGGAHFKEIARLTGGNYASICANAASWNVMFDEIIKTATGLASNFVLKQFALPSSIVVKVDNKDVKRDLSHTNGFDMISSINGTSLIFYGNALPTANQKITVQYDYIQ